jgi:hypothetical protein
MPPAKNAENKAKKNIADLVAPEKNRPGKIPIARVGCRGGKITPALVTALALAAANLTEAQVMLESGELFRQLEEKIKDSILSPHSSDRTTGRQDLKNRLTSKKTGKETV